MKKVSPIYVYLEIGKLEKVLLHYQVRKYQIPTLKFLNVLLFDYILYFKVTQEGYNFLAQILGNTRAGVVYIENLLKKAWGISGNLKRQFFKDFFLKLSKQEMNNSVIGGLRRDELKNDKLCMLFNYLVNQDRFFFILWLILYLLRLLCFVFKFWNKDYICI